MRNRKQMFSHRVPTVQIKGTEIQMRPDLFLVLEAGRVRLSNLSERADLNQVIRNMEQLLEELKDRRHAQRVGQFSRRPAATVR